MNTDRCLPRSSKLRSGLACSAWRCRGQLGGLEVDPVAIVDTLERLSHADGSAGWCGLIGQATAFFGWLEPPVAKELLGSARRTCAHRRFLPPQGGLSLAVDGDYTVEGRWTFASGCLHSELIQLGLFVMDGDRPALRPDGSPDWRFAYVRTSEVEIVDTWDPFGLRGTGSNDIVVRQLRVPPEHMGMPMLDAPKSDDSIYQLGFWGHTAVVLGPFPLGVARRALDELEELLPARAARGGHVPLVQDPQVHYELGRCRGALGAARSFLDETVGEVWNGICSGSPATDADQQRLRLAMQHAMTAGLDAIDVAYRFAGTSVLGRRARCSVVFATCTRRGPISRSVSRSIARRAAAPWVSTRTARTRRDSAPAAPAPRAPALSRSGPWDLRRRRGRRFLQLRPQRHDRIQRFGGSGHLAAHQVADPVEHHRTGV